jgi:acetolactate synthase-1/2/3 large subunit
VRFDDRVTGKIEHFAPNARVIHIDIDAAEIGKNVEVDIPIVGDVKEVLQALLARINPQVDLSEWHRMIAKWKKEFPLCYGNPSPGRIMPQDVINKICEVTQGKAIITTEVGQHQMWTAQYYSFEYPRSFLSSGGLGTMGYGFPAAIGAKIACPDTPVIAIAGDGSIQMNIQELGTAMQYKVPVIICILNNHFLGMVRQWQGLFYGGRYSSTDLMSQQPDFVKLAEAYGAVGMRVTDSADVEDALTKALEVGDRPVIIDFWVEREADVYPMVPPGGSLSNMLGGEEDA